MKTQRHPVALSKMLKNRLSCNPSGIFIRVKGEICGTADTGNQNARLSATCGNDGIADSGNRHSQQIKTGADIPNRSGGKNRNSFHVVELTTRI